MESFSRSGMTKIEMAIAITVLAAIVVLLIIPQTGTPVRMPNTQTLSNMRQLHMAIQQMALDHETTGKPLRWTCEDITPVTREQLFRALVDEGYLGESDLTKLLSAKDKFDSDVADAYSILAISPDDQATALMLVTKNWQGPNSTKLSKEAPGEQSFVTFRKGGDGSVLQAKQVNQTNLIGSGGMHGYLPLKNSP